jgi:hypothetical protein
MVDKVTEIIDYFKPKNYWIENPASSEMKNYLGIENSVVVDYCKYSDFGYRKSTRLWVSKTIEDNFKPLRCKLDCDNLDENRKKHILKIGDYGKGANKLERYRVPDKLIRDLLMACNLKIKSP